MTSQLDREIETLVRLSEIARRLDPYLDKEARAHLEDIILEQHERAFPPHPIKTKRGWLLRLWRWIR